MIKVASISRLLFAVLVSGMAGAIVLSLSLGFFIPTDSELFGSGVLLLLIGGTFYWLMAMHLVPALIMSILALRQIEALRWYLLIPTIWMIFIMILGDFDRIQNDVDFSIFEYLFSLLFRFPATLTTGWVFWRLLR